MDLGFDGDYTIIELANEIKKSTERNLEDRIAIAFSGGLDSSLLAHIAKNNGNCELGLFVVGVEGSEDIEYAEKVSSEMKLGLNRVILNEQDVVDSYNKVQQMLKLDFLKTGILVPAYKAIEAANAAGFKVILFGSASEELFVGYDRYYRYLEDDEKQENKGEKKTETELDALLKEEFATLKDREIGWIKKIAYKFGIEARFPYYDQKIADMVFSIPLADRMAEKDLKKGVLREVGEYLQLPEIVLKRKKRAMQYGSGVQKVLLKHREELAV